MTLTNISNDSIPQKEKAEEKPGVYPVPGRGAGVRRPLVGILLFYLLGLILAYYFNLSLSLLLFLLFLFLSFSFLTFWKRKPTLSALLLLISLILAGFWYHNLSIRLLTSDSITNLYDQGPVEVVGQVASFPQVSSDKTSLDLNVRGIYNQEKRIPSRAKVRLTIRPEEKRLKYGDLILVRGVIEKPSGSRNPKGFDYHHYLLIKKVVARMSASSRDIDILGEGPLNPLLKVALFLRSHLITSIHQTLPPLQRKVLKGIMLGRRGELPERIEKEFRDTGVIHVLAVSGLHVGLIAFIFGLLFQTLRLSRSKSSLLVLLIIFFYCLMIGCRPSVVRASIMFSIATLAYYLGRRRELYSPLALAALIILLINPLALSDIGFQLSFIAVLSILYLYPFFLPKLRFLPLYPAGLISVSLAAWLGVTPLLAYHFNYFAPIAILANLIVVPLVMIIVALGFIVALLNPLSTFLASLFSHANWLFLTGLVKSVYFFSLLPGAGIRLPTPSFFPIFTYYFVIIGLVNFRRSQRARKVFFIGMLSLVALFLWAGILIPSSNLLKVTILDVGQGDSIFIQFPPPANNSFLWRAGNKENILIDGGNGRNDVLSSFLWGQKVRKIDYLISTHPHTDHLGGLIEVLSNFRVGEVIESGQEHTSFTYKKFLKVIKEKRVPYRIARAGQRLENNQNIKIDIFHPQEELIRYGGSQLNNNSIVMKLSYGEISFLFTADIEKEAEELLVRKYGSELHSTILKVPHQGSKTSSTLKFLEQISPECAIISVGARNPFGHPHSGVLKRYQDLGIELYRTDEEGAVIITTDGTDYWVKTMRESRPRRARSWGPGSPLRSEK